MIIMKLNKTLKIMKDLNEKGESMTVYGENQYNKILNFKAVESCDVNGNYLTFKLADGSEITAIYQEYK